jgi:hypothetical protein
MCCIMGYDNSLCLKEFLDQLIFSIFGYVYICNRLRVMDMQANRSYYEFDHSLSQNDIFKCIYCFIILFLTVYVLNIF